MSDIFRDFDKKNEVPKHKTGLADEITQALGINGVYVSVGLTNKKMHLNKLDFTEHDKAFEDKIAKREEAIGYYKDSFYRAEKNCDKLYHENKELKQRIAELESKENIVEVRVPASPIEIATHLINNTCTINELKMIAEHINVYCNGGK